MDNTKRAALAAIAFLAAQGAHAQIATDGSVGARVAFTRGDMVIPESLGRRVGTNLLHSFSTFNVANGERAAFTGTGLQNIIARVTGGSSSRIDGTLVSEVPGSNLFLVNPSGIVFGPNAVVDVPGSFHASTAHYLRLADGTRIAMSATPEVTLTAAPPSAFGFEGAAAPIALQGARLRVPEGRRISLAGGELTLDAFEGRAALLLAPSGTVGIAAVRSAGEVTLEANGLAATGFGAMAPIAIHAGSVVDVSEGAARQGAGAISLAGSDVTIDHATLASMTRFGHGRGIAIQAAGALGIEGSEVLSTTRGAGNAGPLTLRGHGITISGASLVDTSCDPGCTTGTGGALTVNASGRLRLEGTHTVNPTYLVSNSFGGGRTGAIDVTAGRLEIEGNAYLQGIALANGDASTIVVRAGDIVLRNGAQIDGSVQGTGQGGRVTVAATGNLRIEGVRANLDPAPPPDSPAYFPSGIFSSTRRAGNAGDIVVTTRTLDIVGGGEINSSAGRIGIEASGNGGSITIDASERITVRGFGTSPAHDASAIVANTFGAGAGGSIALTSPRVEVLEQGRIQTQGEGGGRSGAVRIAGGDLVIASGGQVASTGFRGGAGGAVTVDLSGTLTISGSGSSIYASTFGEGDGGNVDIAAREARLDDFGHVGAFTDSGVANAGRGGAITMRIRERLAMSGNASVTADSFSTGDGGTLDIRSGGSIELSGGASITSTANTLGDAGAIRVEAGSTLSLASGARITTAALSSDGGDMAITASTALLDASSITTEVGRGLGGGGNMEIRVPTLVMRGSVVTANAFGGPGGNIHIGTTTFIPSADSRVTASSTLGVDGTITLDSPALDPTGELIVPPAAFADAGDVLAGRCGPRLAGRASSLVVAPRAGLAEAPDAWRITQATTPAPWAQPLACVAAALPA